jgi:hypothetical protein
LVCGVARVVVVWTSTRRDSRNLKLGTGWEDGNGVGPAPFDRPRLFNYLGYFQHVDWRPGARIWLCFGFVSSVAIFLIELKGGRGKTIHYFPLPILA